MKKDVKINNVLFSNVVFTTNGENLIFSSSIREEFFGIYTVDIFEESILCEQYKENYANCTVKVNGHTFENVIFRLIKDSIDRIVINENIIDQPYVVGESNKMLDEKDLIIENLRLEVNRLKVDKSKLKKKILIESVQPQAISLQPYKEELFREFVNYTDQQKSLFTESLEALENKLINIIENKFIIRQQELKITTLDEANDHFRSVTQDIYNSIIPDSIEATERVFSEKYVGLEQSLVSSLNTSINSLNKKMEGQVQLIKESFKGYVDNVLNRNKIITEKAESKIEGVEYILEATTNNKKLLTETNKVITKLTKRLDDYGSKINALINEKRNTQHIVESNKQYVDIRYNQLLEESKRYSRIVGDVYAGGGSVAQQYAAGGVIDGNLNITGSILSGGQDLTNIFLEESGNTTLYGNLNVVGSILSAGQPVTSIFAGEGAGDDNTLDGGTY